MRFSRLIAISGVVLGASLLAGCASAPDRSASSATASPTTASAASTPADPSTSAPAPATTSAASTPVNRTGAATVPDYATVCDLFPLTLARTLVPDLPDQPYDHGDGNCRFSSSPDESVSGASSVTWVHPYEDMPDFVTTARDRSTSDQANCPADATCVGVTGSDVAVGDAGFCSERISTDMTASVDVNWLRGSTGFELDAYGDRRTVTCAAAQAVAAAVNAGL